MLSRVAISVRNITKCYHIYAKPQDRLKQMIFRGKKKFYQEFSALKDVTLDIQQGSTLGILGRNGAGKSTLLQIICGTVTPTSGTAKVKGRIGALLELGTGFNPEFSGRENVYLNATILGLSKEEIDQRFDEIIEFADIGDFLEQPVKTYSSGMFIRLAFAVAINIDPDILIVDEALSVGDVQFQAKCFRKFEELRKANKTIIFVSHSPEQIVRHCSRAILIEAGQIIADDKPKTVVNKYLDMMFGIKNNENSDKMEIARKEVDESPESMTTITDIRQFAKAKIKTDKLINRPGYNKLEYRWGSKDAEVVDFMLSADGRNNVNHFGSDEKVDLYLKVNFKRDVECPIYAVTFKTPDGVTIYGTNSRDWNQKESFESRKTGDSATVKFSLTSHLITGHYLISLGVVEQVGEEIIPLDRRYDAIEIYVTNVSKSFGLTDLRMEFSKVA